MLMVVVFVMAAPMEIAAASLDPPPAFIPPPPEDGNTPLAPPLNAQIAEYEVQQGDTIWDIADKFETDPDTLAVINEMGNWNRIYPGDTIKVVTVRGLIHEVKPGDNMKDLAEEHNVDIEDLLAANGLKPSQSLKVGQKLIVPGARPSQEAVAAARGEAWNWPLRGSITITSHFGYRWGRFHHGIDLGAPQGTPVVASRAGRVTRAGWSGGYGNLIIIDHGDGKTTRYAHLSRMAVSVGQRVDRNEIIGYVGSTGRSTGPHLHFEIRVHGSAVNPLEYLP